MMIGVDTADNDNDDVGELDRLTASEGPPSRFPRQLRYALCLGVVVGALYVAASSSSRLGPAAKVDGGGTTATTTSLGSDAEEENPDAWRHNGPHKSPTVPVPAATTSTLAPTLAPVAPPPQPTAKAAGGSSGGDQAGALPTAAAAGDEGGNDEDSEGGAGSAANDSASSTAPPSNANPPGGAAATADGVAPPKKTYRSDFPQGLKPHPNMYSESYLRRAKPLDDDAQKQLTDRWGSWTFVDPLSVGQRPIDDYYANYLSRDVPRAGFPPNAWQTDPDYLRAFLPQAKALVQRTMEAILSEYGHGTDREPSRSFEERSEMFRVTFNNDTSHEFYLNEGDGNTKDAGGYMTPKGHDGLVRRILHAVMTEDTFRVVMGGHSAAAGHGNHFQQSYTLQIQQILEPVFARLGVAMTAHNIGMGGLGTLQNALGMRDMYGGDIDVLVYDAGMTETEPYAMDLFARQGILAGEKVPLLWVNQDFGRFFRADIFKYLADECGADVAAFGSGLRGVPFMSSPDEAKDVAWAAQYLRCDPSIKQSCREKEYMGKCWYDRDDVTPFTKQQAEPGGRASWHPGNRFHQLQGRVFTFIILAAMDKAIDLWSQAVAYALEDTDWHMNSYYDSIRKKLLALDRNTSCHEQEMYPARACDLPLRARSEFTPRLNPYATSIRGIVKGGNLATQLVPNIYDPPDVHNPNLDPGGVDVLNIAENGGDFLPLMGRRRRTTERQLYESKDPIQGSSANSAIKPGLGWELETISAPGNCDGSYDSFCGRSNDTTCLLYGHNDFRGGIKFDGLSGWLIMNLEKLRYGLIIVKIEDWHWEVVRPTQGWTCENNECGRSLAEGSADAVRSSDPALPENSARAMKDKVPDYCADFKFEFAIDGKVTTWDKEEWQKRERKAQRVVQLWTLLDDPTFTLEAKDVELGIRMTGCQRTKIFKLTHVYWA